MPWATRETADGVRQLGRQNAEVIAHLDATVSHLESIAEEVRDSSHQNRRMVRLSIAMLVASLLTLAATIAVAALP